MGLSSTVSTRVVPSTGRGHGLDLCAIRDSRAANVAPARSSWSALHDLLGADLDDLSGWRAQFADEAVIALEGSIRVAAVLQHADEFGQAERAAEKTDLERLLDSNVATNEDGPPATR